MVNITRIRDLDPCKDRLKNYISFYGDMKFTPRKFMGLRNITHSDKIWVAFRSIPKENIGKVSGEIAKTVLHIYENNHPGDMRVRLAVIAAISGTVTPNIRGGASDAASSSTSSASASAGYAAASAAAASYSANAVSGSSAAAFGHYAYSADAASIASGYAIKALNSESFMLQSYEKMIRKICLKYWKDV